jgi:hypothetical protein
MALLRCPGSGDLFESPGKVMCNKCNAFLELVRNDDADSAAIPFKFPDHAPKNIPRSQKMGSLPKFRGGSR